LPISLNFTSVGFDATGVSLPGPLSFASVDQVNVQVPWELSGQTTVQMKVNVEPNIGNLISVPVVTYSPAIFEVNGIAAATVALTGAVVTADAPVTRGQYVSLYCNGLGPVSNQPATGAVAPGGSTLATSPTFPNVMIGGQAATVQFSGLAPGYVALYQVNVLVPANISAGSQPVILSIGGVTAPTLNLPVQ
jgi:minor extracellular serine protease Vpr